MRTSIRVRLTLWNASVLALLLVSFAFAGFATLGVVLGQRGDAAVSESALAIANAMVAERSAARARGEAPRPEMARDAMREMRAGDLDVFIVDEASNVVAINRRRGRRPVHPPTAPAPRKSSDTVTKAASVTGETDTLAVPAPVRALLREARVSGEPIVRSFDVDGPHRVAVVRIAAGSDDDEEPAMAVAAIRASDDDIALLTLVRNTLLLAIPLALLLSIAGGYAIARRSLAPVDAMAAQAARISAATLNERLPVANAHDELGRLATVVNALLERVHVAFRQQRQFVADASHELRTPIAIVRGEADVTLQRAERDEHEYRDALAVIREESVRLTRIVDDLFLLARADAGAPVGDFKSIDLRDVTLGVIRSVRSIADENGIVIDQQLGDAPVPVKGDVTLMQRLLLNLLDNALKYTPRGGLVQIALSGMPHQAELIVHDNGPGIPSGLRARVFDRFVRAGPDERPPENKSGPGVTSSGAGLGLAIATAIVTAHHGTLALEDSDVGTRFRVVLPLAAS